MTQREQPHEASYPQVIAGQTRNSAEWVERGEVGSRRAIQFMAWIATTLGRRVARLVLHPIVIWFVLFSPTARRHSRRYLGRVLGREANWADGYKHVHAFASTVLDRVYFVRGQMQEFDITVRGGEQVDASMADGRGAFLLGAHIGSFEALHAIGEGRPGLKVAMVMYPDNARMIHTVLQALAPDFKLGIIAIGRPGSTLQIRDWLAENGLVGLLGDRMLAPDGTRAADGSRTAELPFLGVPATFSDGPLRLAMLLKRRVMFMSGIYRGGRRYDVSFETLADFTSPPRDPAEREAQIKAALQAYVERLELLVRDAPYNWFNFFDFWNEDH
jgi:predicted LPLAT superfamily acyltransferase